MQEALRSGGVWSTPHPRGEPALLDVLSAMLGVDADRIIVTSSLRATAVPLAGHCRAAFVERPTFSGIPETLAAMGPPVKCLNWQDLAGAAAGQDRPLIWVTSPARNPDGATPGIHLLGQLRDAAAAGDGFLVVNETYRWYSRAAVPDGCVRVGSVSKLAGGGARVGWIIDPPREAERALCRLGPATLWQRAWASFLGRVGQAYLIEKFIHPVDAARNDFLAQADDYFADYRARCSGPSVFLPLGRQVSEEQATSLLETHGILVGPGADFMAEQPSIRLAFTGLAHGQAAQAGRVFSVLMRENPWLLDIRCDETV